GGLMVMNQELSSGALAACTLLSGQVTMPLAKLFSADGQQSLQWQASHDYEALQSLPQEPNLLIGEMPPSSGLLETDSFRLDPGSSLVISGGAVEQSSELLLSMTALQGSFPAAAQFDGRPLESYQRSLLRRRLRLLVPDPGLSPGTLLDNLTVFRSDSLGPKAAQLAAQLGLSPWIQALPKGYDTPIGDNQDFPIARSLTFRVQVISALLDEPAVLLLDASQRDLPLVELHWFLTLPVEASKVLAVRQWSDALPRPDQHLSWQGNQLVEVRS
ncbi:MAG: hypothetical protein ACO3D4_06365, partial [Vulcanococcus sp.]